MSVASILLHYTFNSVSRFISYYSFLQAHNVFCSTQNSPCLPASFNPPCTQVNDSECNSLELTVSGSGHIVKGYAMLDGPTFTGRITFVGSHMYIKVPIMCANCNTQ